jgi:xylulokinase
MAGGGDGQCAGTGVNVMAHGRAYINLGTAVVAGSYGATYAHDRAFRTETAIADGGYIYESCLRAGAFLIDWTVRELFQSDARREPGLFKALEAEAANVPIGAGGLVLVPYWVGCMTPYWDSAARGVVAGLNGSHRRGHIWRALLEGIALEQAMVTDQMVAATGTAVDHFVAIGGGAASDLWCQILADATGRIVHRSTTIEASCLGAGMAAAAGAGWFGSIAAAAEVMAGAPVRSFTPEPKAQARYRELAALHRDLWPLVSAWNRRLAAFAEASDA